LPNLSKSWGQGSAAGTQSSNTGSKVGGRLGKAKTWKKKKDTGNGQSSSDKKGDGNREKVRKGNEGGVVKPKCGNMPGRPWVKTGTIGQGGEGRGNLRGQFNTGMAETSPGMETPNLPLLNFSGNSQKTGGTERVGKGSERTQGEQDLAIVKKERYPCR